MDNERGTEALETLAKASGLGTSATTFDVMSSSSESEVLLGTDVAEAIFEIAIAVLWSDGPLDPEEVQRGRTLANVMGVTPPRGGVFGAIADGPMPFTELGFDRLNEIERRQTYAVALWLTAGHPMGSRRSSFLQVLRLRLGVAEDEAMRIQALVERPSELAGPRDTCLIALLETSAAAHAAVAGQAATKVTASPPSSDA